MTDDFNEKTLQEYIQTYENDTNLREEIQKCINKRKDLEEFTKIEVIISTDSSWKNENLFEYLLRRKAFAQLMLNQYYHKDFFIDCTPISISDNQICIENVNTHPTTIEEVVSAILQYIVVFRILLCREDKSHNLDFRAEVNVRKCIRKCQYCDSDLDKDQMCCSVCLGSVCIASEYTNKSQPNDSIFRQETDSIVSLETEESDDLSRKSLRNQSESESNNGNKNDTEIILDKISKVEPEVVYAQNSQSNNLSTAIWSCNQCTFNNKSTASKCEVCSARNNSKESEPSEKDGKNNSRLNQSTPSQWTCTLCTFNNISTNKICEACSKNRFSNNQLDSSEKKYIADKNNYGTKDVHMELNDGIICPACSFRNAIENVSCQVCFTNIKVFFHEDFPDPVSESILKSWICKECKSKYSMNKYMCVSCRRYAPFFNSWICELCSIHNHKTDPSCKNCRSKNTHIIKCPGCKVDINKDFDKCCDNCKLIQKDSNITEYDCVEIRDGKRYLEGWHCSYCDRFNDGNNCVGCKNMRHMRRYQLCSCKWSNLPKKNFCGKCYKVLNHAAEDTVGKILSLF